MTDPTRFKVNWKTSSLVSPSIGSSSLLDFKLLTTLKTDIPTSDSLPHEQQYLPHTSSLQPFAPFDTETILKDEYDYDQLSTLLSRQLLKEVDADPLPNTCSPTYPHSDLTTIPKSHWYLDDGKVNKTWSPSFTQLSPALSQNHQQYPPDSFDYSSDSTSSSIAIWWDRFGIYEFDPTRQEDGSACFTMMSPPNEQNSNMGLDETKLALDDDTERTPLTIGSPKKRQVCRHYLAGECYRKHCWFAHDLEVKPCKFWLQGSCLKGDTCEFAHRLEELDDDDHDSSSISTNSMINNTHRSQEQPQYPTMADFTISVAKSSRKSKKSRNKKSFKM